MTRARDDVRPDAERALEVLVGVFHDVRVQPDPGQHCRVLHLVGHGHANEVDRRRLLLHRKPRGRLQIQRDRQVSGQEVPRAGREDRGRHARVRQLAEHDAHGAVATGDEDPVNIRVDCFLCHRDARIILQRLQPQRLAVAVLLQHLRHQLLELRDTHDLHRVVDHRRRIRRIRPSAPAPHVHVSNEIRQRRTQPTDDQPAQHVVP